MDWCFQATSLSTFITDLNTFSDSYLYPRMTDKDTLLKVGIFTDIRIDTDWIDNLVAVPAVVDASGIIVTAAVTRGPHCNVRGSMMPGGNSLALLKLDADLKAFFNSQPIVTQDTPLAVQTKYSITPPQYHATALNTKMIYPSPSFPKQVFA